MCLDCRFDEMVFRNEQLILRKYATGKPALWIAAIYQIPLTYVEKVIERDA